MNMNMLSAVSLFAISAASVMLTCDLVSSNHQRCRVLLIRLSLKHVMARVINRHSKGVIISNGRLINGMITRWPLIKNVLKNVFVLILYANNE